LYSLVAILLAQGRHDGLLEQLDRLVEAHADRVNLGDRRARNHV
jgi:hypothetical protein